MELLERSALELGKMIRNKEITIREALDAAFARIREREDGLHCFLTLDEEGAYARGEELQKRLLQGEVTGPLMGVPVAVKDNLCTKGLRTTCASRMLRDYVPPYDATAVENLRQSGMILIGKTNMDEFAMGNTTESSYFGITRNPADEKHSPGGSSGGSAAAVAAGECFCALGTDTGGSVRQPASHCGVVGIKPTYGTVSRRGLIAYASSMDQVGTLTKDLRDGAALLDAVTSWDSKDATSVRREGTSFLNAVGGDVRGMKIGIPRDYFEKGLDPEVADAVEAAAGRLEREGAILKEFTLGLSDYAVPAYYTIACGEVSSNLERYDGMKYGLRVEGRDLQDTYGKTRSQGFGTEVKRRIMLGTFVLSEGYYDAYYLKALRVRRLIKEAFDRAFADVDVMLGPVAPTTAPLLGIQWKDPTEAYLADKYTVPANLVGLPALSIPCGKGRTGLPIGLQLMGNLFQEEKLLRVAGAYEELRDGGNPIVIPEGRMRHE